MSQLIILTSSILLRLFAHWFSHSTFELSFYGQYIIL